jgi:hypothetical protein
MTNPKLRDWYGLPANLGWDALGVIVDRPASALPQTATANIFTVTGGPVLLLSIIGTVTVELGAVANDTKLTFGATDICTVVTLNANAVGTRLSITGTFGDAMLATGALVPLAVQATSIVLPAGASLLVDCAAAEGGAGRVQWTAVYVPLSATANLAAA